MSPAFPRVALFVVIILSAVAGALGALISLRSALTESTWFHIAGTLVYAGLLFGWYTINKRDKPLTPNGSLLYITGVVILLIPTAYYLWVGSSNLYRVTQLALFDRGFEITKYEESLIQWKGFDKPVGLQITLQLSSSPPGGGKFRYPKLLLGSLQFDQVLETPIKSYWHYCIEPIVDEMACMTYPLWPIAPFPEVVTEEGIHTLTYELYPSNLYYREKDRVCLKRRYPYARANQNFSGIAMWHMAAADKTIDLSQRLSATLAEHSQILKDVGNIEGWYQGLRSDTLETAGYQVCQVKQAIIFSEEVECYCLGGSEEKQKN